jgi:hypothetical protein
MLANSLSDKFHNSKLSLLKNSIIFNSKKLNVDYTKLMSSDFEFFMNFPMISSDMHKYSGEMANSSFIPSYETPRYRGTFRLWKSVSRNEKSNHWTSEVCTANQNYFAMFMEEYYGKKDLLENYISSKKKEDNPVKNDNSRALGFVAKHDVLIKIDGVGLLIYTEATSKHHQEIDIEEFIKNRLMVHPYCASPSVHEFFRLLLEWQWAYKFLESREIMATVANDFLTILGLNVDDETNEVVRCLLNIPDQQVAQYIKTGHAELNENPVDCPEIFYNWTKEIMDLINLSYDYRKNLTRETIG